MDDTLNRKRAWGYLPILIGVVLGIGVALWLVQRYFGDPRSPLTAEALRRAELAWREAGISDYDVEVEVKSRQTETYAVHVRDGKPLSAERNGRPLKQIRTFDTWSVPGMFDTIHSDLATADHAKNPAAPELTLQATFDSQTGVPQSYRRIQWGQDLEISWRVTKFERNQDAVE